MKKLILSTIFMLGATVLHAQKPFVGHFYNEEYKIFMHINFDDKNVIVPGQEIFGELDGYIGSSQCNTVWPITSSTAKDKSYVIEVINNYGSEDFTASLKFLNDSTLFFNHTGGSPLKFPVNKKWQKIPSKVEFHSVPKSR